jgi:glyoxylase-like metal-dependent hydrolase (beta-lactamase superfamily II)
MRHVIVALLVLASAAASAQTPPTPPIAVEHVAPGIAVLHGRGGNVLAFHGPDGSLLVDDEFEPAAVALATAIDALGPGGVRYVVNTHWHGDHTGANALLAARGAVTIAHHNVRRRMSADQVIRGRAIPPTSEEMRPRLTYDGDITLHFNREAIRIFHPARAHTDGDSIAHLPRANVLAMGDIFFNRMLPFLDVTAGGSIDGLIAAVNGALNLADERTIIVPGHGAVARRADLVAYRDMLVALRAGVASAMAEGRSLDDIRRLRLADRYVTGLGWITPDELIEAIHTSLRSPG